ncbi:hypothetical protein FJ365_02125 [Candidatus Dependentiae bacterium]|nr:hypothetical protein [Candidatus Dependentiae bacterium]
MIVQLLWLVLIATMTMLQAVVVNGTSKPLIIDYQYVFSNGDSAVGDVYFKKGFTVPAGATITLAITKPIDGPIDLNGTGTIVMEYYFDLVLGANCDGFTNGGCLDAITDWSPGVRLEGDITIQGQFKTNVPAVFYMNNYSITFADGGNPGSVRINVPQGPGLRYRQWLTFRGGAFRNAQDHSTAGPRLQAITNLDEELAILFLDAMDVYMLGNGVMTIDQFYLNFQNAISSWNVQSKGAVEFINGGAVQFDDFGGLRLNPGVIFDCGNGFFATSYRNSIFLNQSTIKTGKRLQVGGPVDGGNGFFNVDGTCAIESYGAGIGDNYVDFLYGIQPIISPAAKLLLKNVFLSELPR